MHAEGAIQAWQWIFVLYFVLLTAGYLLLDIIALMSLLRYMPERTQDHLPHVFTGFEPPISLLVPAFNEVTTIAASVRSLLQLAHPEYKILVINDGSQDHTLEVLIREFSLVRFPKVYQTRLPTKTIRGVYAAKTCPNLYVIGKENGGKADALNAGIHLSLVLFFIAVAENFGYRQLNSFWRMIGLFRWARGKKVTWGDTTRVPSWQSP